MKGQHTKRNSQEQSHSQGSEAEGTGLAVDIEVGSQENGLPEGL